MHQLERELCVAVNKKDWQRIRRAIDGMLALAKERVSSIACYKGEYASSSEGISLQEWLTCTTPCFINVLGTDRVIIKVIKQGRFVRVYFPEVSTFYKENGFSLEKLYMEGNTVIETVNAQEDPTIAFKKQRRLAVQSFCLYIMALGCLILLAYFIFLPQTWALIAGVALCLPYGVIQVLYLLNPIVPRRRAQKRNRRTSGSSRTRNSGSSGRGKQR